MAYLNGPDRLLLIRTLEEWFANAQAGIQCDSNPSAGIIALIKKPTDFKGP